MKKFISIILLASVILSATACSENREKTIPENTAPLNSVSETTAVTVETTATEGTTLITTTTTTAAESKAGTTSEKTETATSATAETTTAATTTSATTSAASSAETKPAATTAPVAFEPEYADGDYEYIVGDIAECEESADFIGDFGSFDSVSEGAAAEKEAPTGGAEDCCEIPWEPPYIEEIQARAGILTGGEWKDNDNWDFWLNLLGQNSDWKGITDKRDLYPDERYKVTVVSGGKPCVGYEVSLFTNENKVWTAVTDNHGEAYLFNTLEKKKEAVEYISIKGEEEEAEIADPTHDEYFDFKYEKLQKIEKLDLMLMIDTTGSMCDELTYLQKELQDVVERVEEEYANSDIRLSVNFYRDEGDDYVVREFPFTDDIDEAVTDLRQQFASGGGDYPEAVTDALDSAINNHKWRQNSTKLMFLVLDAPNHDKNNEKLHKLLSTAAKKGIRIIPVASSGVDSETEFLCRTMAMTTGGTYTFLTDHSGVGGSHLEPTIGDYDVEMLNDMLVRIIGDYMQTISQVPAPAEKPNRNNPNEKPEEKLPETLCIRTNNYYDDSDMYCLRMIHSKKSADIYIEEYEKDNGKGTLKELSDYFDKVDFIKYSVAVQAVYSSTGSAKCELYGYGFSEDENIIEFDYRITKPEICTDDIVTFFLVALVPLIEIE